MAARRQRITTHQSSNYIEPCHAKCSKSELNLFAPHLVQTDEESTDVVVIQPRNAINDTCLEFEITGTDDYLDLANSYITATVRVVKADKDNIAATAKIGPINNLLQSMFSQVDVYLNNTLVSSSDNLYAYRAYLETLLSYDAEAKAGHLTNGLWFQDTAGKMVVNDPLETDAAKKNHGLSKRAEFSARSREIFLHGRLHCDMFHQSRFLLSKCNVQLKLFRSKDAFVLLSSEDNASYKVVIDRATFHAKRVKVSPDTYNFVESTLQKNVPAKYPIKRVEMKSFNIPSNSSSCSLILHNGTLPSRFILGMVNNTAVTGSYTENPFNFQHFDVKHFTVSKNGQRIGSSLSTNFKTGDFLDAYHTLFQALGKAFKNTNVGIKREEYANGYTLWAFDTTPDSSCGHSSLANDGEITLEITFTSGLSTAAALICYAEFDRIITINKDRNVSIL